MLPPKHKVGTNPVFNGPPKSPMQKVGGAMATGARAVGGAAANGAKVMGQGVARTAAGAAQMAKHPVIAAKGGVAQVKNSYGNTFKDPRFAGGPNQMKQTMAANIRNSPVKAPLKIGAAATGALAPAAFVKGAAKPMQALRTQSAMKSDRADAKMGGLSWTPPARGAPGAVPPRGAPPPLRGMPPRRP